MKLLPVDAWPDADLQLWDMTFRHGNILEDDKAGAAWSEGGQRSIGYVR